MKFDELQLLIPRYLSGEMTADEKSLFEAQLQTNGKLRMELEELRGVWEGLGDLVSEQPSAAMRAQFYQKLNSLTKGSGAAPANRWNWSRLIPMRNAGFAAALFLAGVLAGRLPFGTGVQTEQVADLRGQVRDLKQTVALSMLDQDSASSRLEGVAWSNKVAKPDQELLGALLTTLRKDTNINVRLAALDALEKFAGDANVRMALEKSILTQDSPLVQIALIDALVHVGDHGAAGELKTLSTDREVNVSVRQRAEWGLEKLRYE